MDASRQRTLQGMKTMSLQRVEFREYREMEDTVDVMYRTEIVVGVISGLLDEIDGRHRLWVQHHWYPCDL